GSVRSTTLNVLLSNVCPRRSARFPARTSGTALANAISSRASRDTRSQSGNRGRAGPHARWARCGQPPRARLLSPAWLREAAGRRPPHHCLPRDAVHRRHAPSYEGLLCFRRFGALTACDAVNGAPAVGLRLDLRALDHPLGDSFAADLFSAGARAHVRASLERDLARAWRPLKFFHSRGRAHDVEGAKMC